MLIGMAGVLVLVSDSGLSGTWSGTSLVFVACISWSFGSALSRRIDMPAGFMATAIEMVAAAVIYLIFSGSIAAFTAFTYLISHVSGPLAMSCAYVNPAIAVLLGVVFGDESMSSSMAIALPIILVGVAIVTNSSRGVKS